MGAHLSSQHLGGSGGQISQVEDSLVCVVSSRTAKAIKGNPVLGKEKKTKQNKTKNQVCGPRVSALTLYRLEKEIDVLEFGESAPAAPKENSAAPSPVGSQSTSPAKEEQKSETVVNAQQVREKRQGPARANPSLSAGGGGCAI